MAVPFDPDDIDPEGLEQRHRDAMLDCVLAWARFEGSLRALVSAVEKRPLDEGARLYKRMRMSIGWNKLIHALRDAGATSAVLDQVRALRRGYREKVKPRQYIAHAGCVGVLKRDRDYIVFAAFESDRPGELVVLYTPLDEISRSTDWADGANRMANNLLRLAGH